MADLTQLARVDAGRVRNEDLTVLTPVLLSLKVGGGAINTELTKAILDNLIALQNGTDYSTGTNSHTHDGRYWTKVLLLASTPVAGSTLIGDNNTYANFTPGTATVKGALNAIDSKFVPFTGDSGTGGVKGLVPAPAAGDGIAGKFLAATGIWDFPPGASVIYEQRITVISGSPGANQIAGPVTPGTQVILPAAGTYNSTELFIFLNGQRLSPTNDWNVFGSVPRTRVTFVDTLVVGDVIDFSKQRNF